MHYNSDHKLIVKTDVSDYVSEKILFQYNDAEILYLIAYFFKKHNSVKCNYEIYDKKLMIIVHVFEKWWFELKDTVFFIDMITNHKNLEYFIMIKQFNYCQACWNKFLFCFNFKIVYCSEKADDKSDALTHQSENLFKKRNNSDKCLLHQNQIVLKKHNFNNEVIQNFQNKIIVA